MMHDSDAQTPKALGRSAMGVWLAAGGLVLLLVIAALGYLILGRLEVLESAVERRLATVGDDVKETRELALHAIDRAAEADTAAQAAAAARAEAEAIAAGALQEADAARYEADAAREVAARAQAEAAAIRKQAETELNRLEETLGQIAETRRTALGLVMNLGSDYLKFGFDKAELRQQDRELLSRIAGTLLTSKDYTISVNGHTDNIGSATYNKELSKRRAIAVRDYLIEAGLPADIFSVTGHGKERPLVLGDSEEALAKNRRVELGLVNTRVQYGRAARQ
jgi:outer membrane protein OmpA-like peptidoglycan-associated protein